VFARNNLGLTLRRKGDLDGAVAEYREALRVNPKHADARSNLGYALQLRGDVDGAIREYQEALRASPKHTTARENLTWAQRWRDLLARIPAVAAGRAEPGSPAEACEFARICGLPMQGRYTAAVRLYAGAFAAEPALAADLSAGHRYHAAAAAARASGGAGAEPPPGPDERAALRARALAWLRDDLARRRKQAASSSGSERVTAARNLPTWLTTPDFAGLRPGVLRIGVPAGERAAWDALWADVGATLADARKPAPPPEAAPPPRAAKP
jgi:tetratricopeptide (TPR) repeat protein